MSLDLFPVDYRNPETLVASPTRSYEGDGECAQCHALICRNHMVSEGVYHVLSQSRRDHFHQVRLDLTSGRERHACSCEWGSFSMRKGAASSCVHVRIALLKEALGQRWSWRSRAGEEDVELFDGDEYGVLSSDTVYGDNCCHCAGYLAPMDGCSCVCHLLGLPPATQTEPEQRVLAGSTARRPALTLEDLFR